MPVIKAMLVTIIAESGLLPKLKDLAKQAGATGYTIENVSSGFGTHGSREGDFEGDQTIKMLLIVTPQIAHAIFEEIENSFEPHYAIKIFRHEVEVREP